MPPRGRYAPSPTGLIHLGNARTALAAWLSIRAQGGAFVWRLEDLDGPRVVPGMAEAAQRDLAWLGLDWDEGPGVEPVAGPHAPYRQSERSAHYEAALKKLAGDGRLFPCHHSRRKLFSIASAPHGRDEGLPPYPKAWRPQRLAPGWYNVPPEDAAFRFRVDDGLVCFDDRLQGRVCEDTAAEVGDFVLKRRDGVYAYQLAVVVDDALMGITEVVRGADLLASTARQIGLFEALGVPVPTFAHLGLTLGADGEKLSKRDAGLALAALRDAGVSSEKVCGVLGHSLGLLETPEAVPAAALVPRFRWLPQMAAAWQVPEEIGDPS